MISTDRANNTIEREYDLLYPAQVRTDSYFDHMLRTGWVFPDMVYESKSRISTI